MCAGREGAARDAAQGAARSVHRIAGDEVGGLPGDVVAGPEIAKGASGSSQQINRIITWILRSAEPLFPIT